MAGGVMIAGDLWIPGQKLISIPNGKVFYGPSIFELVGNDIRYIGPDDKTVRVSELQNWIIKQFPKLMTDNPYDTMKPHMVSLRAGCRFDKPEHLVDGTLSQDRTNGAHGNADREYWSCEADLSGDELCVDKVYAPDWYSAPAEIDPHTKRGYTFPS
jgi:hypothetical protein